MLNFEPGEWTIPHSHNGPSYNTVLEGEVTLRIGDVERTFGVGEGWVDKPGVVHTAGNQGTVPARFLASFVVSRGVPPSTFVESEDEDSLPPEPTVVAASKMTAIGLTGPMDVVQRVIDVEAGATVPTQAQAGPSIISVLDGNVAVDVDGTTRTLEAGDSWVESAEVSHGYTAEGTTARLVITSFVPRGAPVGSPSEQTATAPARDAN